MGCPVSTQRSGEFVSADACYTQNFVTERTDAKIKDHYTGVKKIGDGSVADVYMVKQNRGAAAAAFAAAESDSAGPGRGAKNSTEREHGNGTDDRKFVVLNTISISNHSQRSVGEVTDDDDSRKQRSGGGGGSQRSLHSDASGGNMSADRRSFDASEKDLDHVSVGSLRKGRGGKFELIDGNGGGREGGESRNGRQRKPKEGAPRPKKPSPCKNYALKSYRPNASDMDDDGLQECRNEIAILREIDHPNIVRIHEVFRDGRGNPSVVMDYYSGTNLHELFRTKLDHVPEREAKRIVCKLVEATNYLHKRGIMHRDLSLAEIVPESDDKEAQIKIIDFGLACRLPKNGAKLANDASTSKIAHTSPEIICGQYNQAHDMWAIGALTYQLLSGDDPFQAEDLEQITNKVVRASWEFRSSQWLKISKEAKDFIRNLLVKKPEKRYTAEQALKSPWLRGLSKRTCNQLLADGNRSLGKCFLRLSKHKTKVFRIVAFNVIARRASEKQISELRDIFHALDTDHDGLISLSDMTKGLASICETEDIQDWFDNADVDSTRMLTYTKFLGAAMNAVVDVDAGQIEEAFLVFDRNRKGYITREDLYAITGMPAGCKFIEQNIREVGPKNSGDHFTFDDFCSMIQNH